MTTKQAFENIIFRSDFHQKTHLAHSRISQYRRYIEGNTSVNFRKPTIEHMEELLLKYGAKVITEKTWDLP